MTRRRALWIAGGAVAALGVAAVAVVAVIESPWFAERVREGIAARIEEATGGRVEIESFRFDWRALRAEIRGFTLHGTETPPQPPLLRVQAVTVGLKLVSVLRRDVNVRSLEVSAPRVNLIVYPDGRTNVPQPRAPAAGSTVETILKLAIAEFRIANGIFTVDSRRATPFAAHGQNLAALVRYAGIPEPRYEGTVRIAPLELAINGGAAQPVEVALTAVLEKSRVTVSAGRLASAGSSVEFSGAVEDWSRPHGTLHYDAHVALADVARVFHAAELLGGEGRAQGTLDFTGTSQWSAAGNVQASGVGYRDSTIAIRDGRFGAAMTAGPSEIDLRGARVSGVYVSAIGQAPADGRIAEIVLRERLLELRNISLGALGGIFRGQGRLRDWRDYTVEGEIAGFAARRVVALYSRAPLPWDAQAAGTVRLEGALARRSQFRAAAKVELTPAAVSAPVHGQIDASYDASRNVLDLGHSTLSLPASRAEFAGAFGRSLRVSLETRDLNDLLPILGENAAELPVRLTGGTAKFDGSIMGPLDRPQFAGTLSATQFAVDGRPVDSLRAEVTASPENIHLQNAVASRGAVTARFDAAIGLQDWHAGESSPIYGAASLSNAPAADLLTVAQVAKVPVTGSVSVAVQFSGTVGKPLVQGSVSVRQGSVRNEPVESASARLAYGDNTLTLTGGQASAAGKTLGFSGSFHHEPGRIDAGRAHFEVSSNAMRLDEIRTLEPLRHGLTGTVQLTANGDVDLTPAPHLMALTANVSARGLQLDGQRLGDADLHATSQGPVLQAHVQAGIAGSTVNGDGTVRLEGDDPVDGVVKFSRIDFAQLRPWLPATPVPLVGFAEGEVRISGPALHTDALRAELRVPSLEIGPAPSPDVPVNLTLRNAGPIVAALKGSTVTVSSARLVGRITDVTLSGKLDLGNPNPLDLRVAGRIDLAAVHEFNRDFTATGTVNADAGVRGTFAAPRITGRVQFQDAAFNVADFPNGISSASGVIVFTGDRATIQAFEGETGGGKVRLTGFAGYDGGRLVFQVHAAAKEVRVRYPEGVSTVADANLRLTGTSDRSTLGGTITIRRTGFNPQSDFGSLIATSAEPTRTPSARTGLLGGINFDVQIESAPDAQFQSSLTQDLQVDVNLRLRGTLGNPALVGRINIVQGQVVFYGTKYTIHQGSVAFYNPLKIDPVFDIDLETKARGIDITLTISGTLNKLNLTPRSDPPLQFSEIVQLLATGDAPALDPALIGQQNGAPQGWQQSGASALLGQAIASPVTGRLQKFFGVSRLRIDPTLPGIETNNPQARVTLEQQVTPDITFTYITNVTSTNPQVVRMEWAFAKRWSVVALREENGVFGLDFFYKKRF
ncbi:MAG TPA: translocation/assembly module TamB domain-containing protein [Bryobacteraceae bacterium]|jgi:translocation and assembly module TamB|nr:translocation/assembly module TamB domain-containing protein [Bryobacteraceae bacterium]